MTRTARPHCATPLASVCCPACRSDHFCQPLPAVPARCSELLLEIAPAPHAAARRDPRRTSLLCSASTASAFKCSSLKLPSDAGVASRRERLPCLETRPREQTNEHDMWWRRWRRLAAAALPHPVLLQRLLASWRRHLQQPLHMCSPAPAAEPGIAVPLAPAGMCGRATCCATLGCSLVCVPLACAGRADRRGCQAGSGVGGARCYQGRQWGWRLTLIRARPSSNPTLSRTAGSAQQRMAKRRARSVGVAPARGAPLWGRMCVADARFTCRAVCEVPNTVQGLILSHSNCCAGTSRRRSSTR